MRRLFLKASALVLLLLLLAPVSAGAATMSRETSRAIKSLKKEYSSAAKGGIALVGSSSLARWRTAEDQFTEKSDFEEDQIYNFGISGATFDELLDSSYINLIASRKPEVIVIYGANDLKKYPSRASRNREVITLSVNTRVLFVEKLRGALARRGVSKPRIILVSTIKTPKQYNTSQKSGKSCAIWDRTDQFNTAMKAYARTVPNCTYLNLEQYIYYKDGGSLKFYTSTNFIKNRRKAATAKQLLSRKKKTNLFCTDLNHPSADAYSKVWKKVVAAACD